MSSPSAATRTCTSRVDREQIARISNSSIAALTALFFRLSPIVRASTLPFSVSGFELSLQVSDILEAKLFRSDRPRLPNAANDQIGIGDTIGGGKQGVAAGLINEEVERAVAARCLASPCGALRAPPPSSGT